MSTLRLSSLAILLTILPTFAACTSDSGGAAPKAPTALAAVALSGGAHLTWTDNSTDEDEFMIMRMQVGVDTAMKHLTSVPFNGTQYHDAPLTSGKMYMYMVVAMNANGEGESNQITFNAP